MKRASTTLTTRVAAASAGLFVIGCLVFGFVVARAAREDMSAGVREVVAASAAEVDQVVERQTASQSQLLDRAVVHLTENISREFDEIPFEVFSGREDLLITFLKRRVAEAREINNENSAVVGTVVRDLTMSHLKHQLEDVESRYLARGDELGRRLSRDLLMWGGIFLLGLSGGIGLVFRRLVIVPLRSVVDVIEDFGEGRLDCRITPRGADEMWRLAVSFNSMAAKIAAYQTDLERDVELKTRALSVSLDKEKETNEKLSRTLKELEDTQRGLVQSEKMAALGTMAQGMAHEFNNILGGIAGCAQDLKADILDPEAVEVLDVITRTARRAGVITDNLLRFSRGGTGDRTSADLREVIKTAVSLVQPEAGRKKVNLSVEGPAELRRVVDTRGLQQVVLNLLINALQAVSTGGAVRVESRVVNGGVCVDVVDDGAGIPKENLEKVFEPFFTTKEPPSPDGRGGTGLGLSVSLGIVRSMGGSITAYSEGPGRGSRFEVFLPDGRV